MDIQGMIQNAVQDKIVEQIAAKTGLQGDMAKKAISIAMPIVMGGISQSANSEAGQQALNTAIDNTDVEAIDEAEGGNILGSIFGKDEEAKVGSTVAAGAGVSEEQAQSITKMLASSAMGQLSAEKAAGTDVADEMKKDSAVQSLLTGFLDQNGDGTLDKDDLMKKGVDMLKNKFFG